MGILTMSTAGDLISRALKMIGQLAAGEAAAAEDLADGLDILNGMLDAWSMDRLYIYSVSYEIFALTGNQQDYTIGPTGGFVRTQVPVKLEDDNANIIITSQTPNVRRPLYVMDDGDWMSISIRPLPTSSIPTAVYLQRMNETTYPNATLHFWPTPTSGLSFEAEFWTTISQFANAAATFSFPPGYFEAVYQNLALRMCTPEFGFNEPPVSIASLAQASRARIESLNMDPPPQLLVDAGLQGTRQGEYRAGQQRFNIKNPAPQWYR